MQSAVLTTNDIFFVDVTSPSEEKIPSVSIHSILLLWV